MIMVVGERTESTLLLYGLREIRFQNRSIVPVHTESKQYGEDQESNKLATATAANCLAANYEMVNLIRLSFCWEFRCLGSRIMSGTRNNSRLKNGDQFNILGRRRLS